MLLQVVRYFAFMFHDKMLNNNDTMHKILRQFTEIFCLGSAWAGATARSISVVEAFVGYDHGSELLRERLPAEGRRPLRHAGGTRNEGVSPSGRAWLGFTRLEGWVSRATAYHRHAQDGIIITMSWASDTRVTLAWVLAACTMQSLCLGVVQYIRGARAATCQCGLLDHAA